MTVARRWAPLAVLIAGIAGAAAVASAVGVPAHQTARLLLESSAGAGVAVALAAVLMTALRRTRIAVHATIAALAPVAAVAIGVWWATSDMFLMGHDSRILWVVLVGAGAAGMAAALLLGQRIAGASSSVAELARRLGENGPELLTDPHGGGPAELAKLAAQLEQTSARLAEAQTRAEANERARRELVAWASHDLRTPLAGIRAMVEALEDGIVDDPATVSRYYATMRLEADRLAGLVDDLFELSRIQSGRLTLETEPVALDEILADAAEGAAVAAKAKGIDLRVDTSESALRVEVSAPEMIRVVRNLLDNAIRHTPDAGTVTVAAAVSDSGSHVEVSVYDGCGGIPAEDLHRVFDMGFRGNAARTPGDGRGGLGLAVAQGLVAAHQGSISVGNEELGCRFTVRLPLHQHRNGASPSSAPG